MSDVISIFGILLIIGLAFPALLTAVWLTLPAAVDRARQRVESTPKRCFMMGLFNLVMVGIPAAGLLDAPSAVSKAMGWGLLFLALALATIGAAGIAAWLSQRLNERSSGHMSALSGFISGAVALELAAIFPLIGWLTVLPIALITAMGATVFAVLRWRPRSVAHRATPQPSMAVVQ